MNKKLHFKSLLLLAVMLVGGVNSAWAEEVKFTLNEEDAITALGIELPEAGKGTKVELLEKDGVSIAATTAEGKTDTRIYQGSGNNAGKYDFRIYADGTLTFTAGDNYITKIVFTGKNLDKLSDNNYKDGTWTGSAQSVTLKATGTATIYTITVTFSPEGTTSTKTETTVTISKKTEKATLGETIEAPEAVVEAVTGTVTSPAIKWSSSSTDVATIDENTGEIELKAAGKTTITATYEGNDTYESSSASYELTVTAPSNTTYTTIAELQSNATETETPIKFTFNNIQVTAVKNKNAYITDGEFGALIYTDGHGLKAGDIINGTIETTLVLYRGQTEITGVKATDENLTITPGTVTPTEKTLDEISAANQSLLVTLKGLTYNSANKTFAYGPNTIAYYKSFASEDPNLEDGQVYDVTGVVIVYNKTLEISPLSADDVVVVGSSTQEAPACAWVSEGTEVSTICLTPGERIWESFVTNSTGDLSFASSNPDVATVDDSGNITLTGSAGVAVITGATEANNDFFAGSATLSIVVAEQEAEDGVFDFALFNDYGSGLVPDGNAYITEESTWTAGNATMKVSGKYRWYLSTKNVGDFRLYSAGEGNTPTTFTVSVPEGYIITSINGVVSSLEADKGEINSTTWTGMENEVTFTYTANATIKKLTVNYSKPEIAVTIGDNYTTFCSNVPLDFSESGIKVYTAKQSKGSVVLTEVESGKVPASRGVILKGDAGEYTVKVIESAEKLENNELYGVTVDTEVEYQSSKTMFNYILQGGAFYKATGAKLKAGKAYLHTAYDITNGGEESRLTIVIDGEATGIKAIETAGDQNVYDLQGRKVTAPRKGLYIISGKKYIVK